MTDVQAPVLIVVGQGALLVRPDRFVAWRSLGATSDPESELERALQEVLAR